MTTDTERPLEELLHDVLDYIYCIEAEKQLWQSVIKARDCIEAFLPIVPNGITDEQEALLNHSLQVIVDWIDDNEI